MTNTTKTGCVQKDCDELVNTLRSWDGCWPNYNIERAVPKAADTIERQAQRIAELEKQLAGGGEAVAWVRMLNGKIDWSEDCLGSASGQVLECGGYETEEEYSEQPLYLTPPTASAAVAAFKRKAEEVVSDALIDQVVNPDEAIKAISALPCDQSALRDALVEAITAYARQVATKNNGNIVLLDLEEALAIVERVLKVEA